MLTSMLDVRGIFLVEDHLIDHRFMVMSKAKASTMLEARRGEVLS